MRILPFKKNLNRAQQYNRIKEKSEPFYINKFLVRIHRLVQEKKQENPKITMEELKDFLDSFTDKMIKTVFLNTYALNTGLERSTCIYLKEHPEITDSLMNDIDKNHLSTSHEHFESQGNPIDDRKEFLLVLSKQMSEILEQYDRYFSEDIIKILNSSTLSPQDKLSQISVHTKRNILPQYRKTILDGARVNLYGIKAFLPIEQEFIENDLRQELIESTSAIVENLNTLGLIDSYQSIFKSQMHSMGLDGFVPESQEILTALSENYLKNCSIEELSSLNAFWVNRYSKELDTYAEAMFAIYQFDLLPRMFSENLPLENQERSEKEYVETKDLQTMLLKLELFYFPAEQFFSEQESIIDEKNPSLDELSEEEIKGGFIRFSYEPFIEEMKKAYKAPYTDFFSKELPNNPNDIETDLNQCLQLQNAIHCAKISKDELISITLLTSEKEDAPSNMGIILDDISEDGTYADIPIFVGIAKDSHTTAPLRLHFRRDVLADFLESYTGNTMLQIYKGSEDFTSPNGKTLSTPIMLPFTKKMEKYIKTADKKDSKIRTDNNAKYLSHINFLRDPKRIPPHLKTSTVDEFGRKVDVFSPRYIDVKTGFIFEKVNGEFLRVSPTPIKSSKGDEVDGRDE